MDILFHGFPWEKLVKILKHHYSVNSGGGFYLRAHLHGAFKILKPCNTPEQGGFSAARGFQDAKKFPPFYFKTKLLKNIFAGMEKI